MTTIATPQPIACGIRAVRLGAFAGALLCAAMAVGCAGRGQVDVLESRLRDQEDRLHDLDSQLATARQELSVARRESDGLRTQLASQGEEVPLVEQAGLVARAEGVQFNKLRTGGLDTDGVPGDDIFTAILCPHDADGELVKLPGAIEVELFEAPKGGNRKIGSWQFSVDESGKLWHRGFLASGYLLRLPWQEVPRGEKLLLQARLIAPDGRRFEARETVTIVPPSSASVADIAPAPAAEDSDTPPKSSASTEPAAVQQDGKERPVPPTLGTKSQSKSTGGEARVSDWWDQSKSRK